MLKHSEKYAFECLIALYMYFCTLKILDNILQSQTLQYNTLSWDLQRSIKEKEIFKTFKGNSIIITLKD